MASGKTLGNARLMTIEPDLRLSRIVTAWNSVLEAHGSCTADATSARQRLLLRYHGAVYRYLLVR